MRNPGDMINQKAVPDFSSLRWFLILVILMTFTAGWGQHCEESHEELDGPLQNLIYTLAPPINKICYIISDCQTLATSIVLDSYSELCAELSALNVTTIRTASLHFWFTATRYHQILFIWIFLFACFKTHPMLPSTKEYQRNLSLQLCWRHSVGKAYLRQQNHEKIHSTHSQEEVCITLPNTWDQCSLVLKVGLNHENPVGVSM